MATPRGTPPGEAPARRRAAAVWVFAGAAALLGCSDTIGSTPGLGDTARPTLRRVVLTRDHVCVLRPDGTVRCVAHREGGQLGDGGTAAIPAEVPGLRDVTSLAAGYERVCAVSHGAVLCWEPGASGAPTPVEGVSDATQVALRFSGGCALTTQGAVFCWGDSGQGQLGDGTGLERASPVQVVDLRDVRQIASSQWRATCAIVADRSVWCWGSFGNNTTTRPTRVRNLEGALALGAGMHAFCATTARDIRCWGQAESDEPTFDAAVRHSRPNPVSVAVMTWYGGGRDIVCGAWPNGSLECAHRFPDGRGSATIAHPDFPVVVDTATRGFNLCAIERGGGALFCSDSSLADDPTWVPPGAARRIDGLL